MPHLALILMFFKILPLGTDRVNCGHPSLAFLCVCVFLGPHIWHMLVPGLEVRSELHLPAYTTATEMLDLSCICSLRYSSQQSWVLKPLSEAGD